MEHKTATEIMMASYETDRLMIRDRAIAMSATKKAMEEHFDTLKILDMADARRQAARAAEQAAYDAIQAEREHHAGDMAMLKSILDAHLTLHLAKPMQIFVETDQ